MWDVSTCSLGAGIGGFGACWHILGSVWSAQRALLLALSMTMMNSTHLLQEDALEDEGDDAGAGTAKRARTALLDSDDEDELPAAPPDTVKGPCVLAQYVLRKP